MSSRKLRVCFVANEVGYDPHRRTSALHSIVCSMLSGIADRYEVTVNGVPFEPRQLWKSASSRSGASNFKNAVKMLPRRVVEACKEYKSFGLSKQIAEETILCLQEPPDMILELYRFGSDLGLRLSQHYSVPLIVHFDGPVVEEFEIFKGFRPFFSRHAMSLEEKTLLRSSSTLVYSNHVRRYLCERIDGLDGSRMSVVQPLDYTRMTPITPRALDREICIGFIGSFSPWHRVDILVDAFNQLLNARHPVRLLLVGDGSQKPAVERKIKQQGLSKHVSCLGFVDSSALYDAKEEIDIGVYPSSAWYNIPTKAFEYGAAGMCAVVPRVGTTAEIFGEDDVVFFENESSESLYQVLKQLVVEPSLLQQRKIQLQDSILARYRAETMRDETISLLNRAFKI